MTDVQIKSEIPVTVGGILGNPLPICEALLLAVRLSVGAIQVERMERVSLRSRMRFLRSFVVGTLVLLTFCSVMVIRQYIANDSQHVELRESLFLLVKKGYTKEANTFYQRLLINLQDLSDKTLIDDIERAAMLVDTTKSQTDNLIWRFYWSVHNELEKRAEIRLGSVLQNAETK